MAFHFQRLDHRFVIHISSLHLDLCKRVTFIFKLTGLCCHLHFTIYRWCRDKISFRNVSTNKALLANLAAATAAMNAGALVVATRLVIGETDPVTLAFYRYALAATCMAPILLLVWPRFSIPVWGFVKIAVLGALFFGFLPWAFSASLQYTTAARGAVGLATIPIQTLIIAALLRRETLTRSKLLSVGLAFAGIAIVFGPEAVRASGSEFILGDILMLLGAFSAAVYSVFGRTTLRRHGPMFVTALAMMFGVMTLFPLALAGGAITETPTFTREGWLALLFLGTLGGAVQFSLFTWALRWLPATRTVIYLALIPISEIFLATVILGESGTAVLMIGLLFVLSGILVSGLLRKNDSESKTDPRELGATAVIIGAARQPIAKLPPRS